MIVFFLLTNVGGTVGASCRSGVGLITGMVLVKQVFLAGLMLELVGGTVGPWCRWAAGSVGALILTLISCTVLFVLELVGGIVGPWYERHIESVWVVGAVGKYV